jgi:para-nitrobenzyl esterase
MKNYPYSSIFVAGDGSESRYDGESMAQKGIVTLTVNYRLGIFGFLAHPELTKESAHQSSGNYGLLDQNAALRWVQDNIAAFGGDPKKVTIAGESAGSIAVCAQMASPLSKNLFAAAIGESGGMINPTLAPVPLTEGEKNGLAVADSIGAKSLADLRAIPAARLLDAASKPGLPRLAATIDGYFLTKSPAATFADGEQAHVPLLVGWNSTEVPYQFLMQGTELTTVNYIAKIKQLYGENAGEALRLYPAATDEETIKSATALSSDRFIVYSTWKWADLQTKNSGKPVYRYLFSRARPDMKGNNVAGLAGGVIKGGATTAAKKPVSFKGAVHASEIEYAMGNLAGNKFYNWTPEDYKVSATMENYFANFIKTGNPNGKDLPKWEANTNGSVVHFMDIDVNTHLEAESDRARYLFLDGLYMK